MNDKYSWIQRFSKPFGLFFAILAAALITNAVVMSVCPLPLLTGRPVFGNIIAAIGLALAAGPVIWLIIVRYLKRAAVLIEEQEEFVTNLVENSAVPTFVIDSRHRVLIWNRACTELTGVKGSEMIGTCDPWRAFYPERRPVLADLVVDCSMDKDHLLYSAVKQSKFIPGGLQAEGWYENLNGHDRYISFSAAPIRNKNGDLVAAIETFEDITDLKAYEEQLEYHASHDMLTRLPNRNLLADRVQQALLLSRRNRDQVVVFMIDLDNFKLVNESLGHDTGNMLLKKVAERLNSCLRAGDTIARQGGDEFIVVISGPDVADYAARKAAEIQEIISRPFQIEQNELILTCTMGISIFPKDSNDVDTLLNNAGSALYRAKELGRGVFQFYTDQMNIGAVTRIVMQQNLRRALEGNVLSLHYQPKVDISTGLVAGLEALVRWNDPELGMIPPSSFIPLAEDTGLIEHLGEWVLRTACAQNKSWQDAGLPPAVIAVNLSARQFRQRDLAGMIGQILAETGLEPRYLELEITESVVMHNVEKVSAILDELKSMGVYLTMDDFGTGYSSLSSLKRFPFDKIKIDQSFVRDITSDPHSAAIARTIIVMAHSLHLEVIAEGVETEGQLNYLKEQKCDVMQGYLFSEPVPADALEIMLRENFRRKSEIDAASISGKTILVVDDEEAVLDALSGMLTMEGYRVLAAASADAGFEMLAGNRVSVVVSDQRMPLMSGTVFLGRVKELYPDTVRILMTGHADMESIMEAINNGAIFKILQKPLHADFFRGKIEEAFKFHELISWKNQSDQ